MTAPDKIWAARMGHSEWLTGHTEDRALANAEPYHHQRTVDELLEALGYARETILDRVNARGSEAEGSDADWVGDIDALIAKHRKGG